MHELWKRINSPRTLLVFEAAARHCSFTLAGQELNVSQPAISASILRLEAALGVKLFRREHRKITLTQAGEKLYLDVSEGFGRILNSVQAISNRMRIDHVTLSVSTAFAHYWMVPKLADFHHSYPQIDLRLLTSERETELENDGVSMAIRRGSGHWPGCEAAPIAQEVIFPIASPKVMEGAKDLRTLEALLDQNLIHLEEPIRDRPDWKDYFKAKEIAFDDLKGGLRLNDYALVLQAAMAGEGFAFGWAHVTRDLIAAGLLAARTEWAWSTGLGFYLVWPKHADLSPHAQEVRRWIIAYSQELSGLQD